MHFELLAVHDENCKACQNDEELKLGACTI